MGVPEAWNLWGVGYLEEWMNAGGSLGMGVLVLTAPLPTPGSKALEAQTGPQRRVSQPRTRSGSRPRPSPRSRSRPGTSGGCRRPTRRARG